MKNPQLGDLVVAKSLAEVLALKSGAEQHAPKGRSFHSAGRETTTDVVTLEAMGDRVMRVILVDGDYVRVTAVDGGKLWGYEEVGQDRRVFKKIKGGVLL